MYFSQLEKGYYDLKGDGNEKLVTDLMTRVKVREKVIDEASLYDRYLIEVNSDAAGAQSVSNREYEQRLQDSRRQIQLLSPSYLNTFLEEFNELVRT